MKQFINKHRKNIFIQGLYSGSILSLYIYILFRFMYYEFPMTWAEEIFFFLKTVGSCCLLIASCTAGSAYLYGIQLRMKMKRRHALENLAK